MAESPLIFLGAYVINANSQVAWGADASMCQISLVEDPANGITFNPPPLGTACQFSFGGFSFGGILQRWTYQESVEQGRTYDVVIESPSKILDGVYVILDAFQGTFYQDDANQDTPYAGKTMTYGGGFPTNVINIFAQKENFQYGGKFGKADVNQSGYPVKNIIADIAATMKAGKFGGKITYSKSEYDLDLSDLQQVIDGIQDYRIQGGPFMDMNSLIRNITDIGLAEYIVELRGTADSSGVIAKPTIYIKTILRKEAPKPGVVKSSIEGYKKSGVLASYSIGKELSDCVTQKVLLGAPASRYWFAPANSYIFPIWGSTGIGENTIYYYGNSIKDYMDPFAKIKITVDGGYEGNFTTVDTNLLELRCAMADDRNTWAVYSLFTALKAKLDDPEAKSNNFISNYGFDVELLKQLYLGLLCPNDLQDTSISNAEVVASYLYGDWQDVQKVHLQRVVNARYMAVKQAAQSFYGKKYLVAMPLENGGQENNYRWIKENDVNTQKEFSWALCDSAWCSEKGQKQIPDSKFYTALGRLKSVAVYPNYDNADYSSLGYEYGRISDPFDGVVAHSSVDATFDMKFIDKNFVQTNIQNQKDSTGKPIKPITDKANELVFCLVTIDSPIPIYDEITTDFNGFSILGKLILGVGALSYHNMFGFNAVDCPIPPAPLVPWYLGVPQESKRYCWGPWYGVGDGKGKALVWSDPVFAPEILGGIKAMNEQAQTYINSDLGQVFESESGFVRLAEKPQFNLAERFAGAGPYITGLSMEVAVGGITTTYQFATWTKRGANLAKYNIDRIAKSQRNGFDYNQKIRNLYRNPVPKPIGPLFGLMERRGQKTIARNTTAVNGVFGNFMNAGARSVDGYDLATGQFPGVNVQGLPLGGAKEGFGLAYKQSFGGSMEQQHSLGFIFNQRDGMREQVKTDYNT
jgi:hypothetical protein